MKKRNVIILIIAALTVIGVIAVKVTNSSERFKGFFESFLCTLKKILKDIQEWYFRLYNKVYMMVYNMLKH